MNMPIQAVVVPLFDDGQGGLRVTGTRVLLERIVHAFGLARERVRDQVAAGVVRARCRR